MATLPLLTRTRLLLRRHQVRCGIWRPAPWPFPLTKPWTLSPTPSPCTLLPHLDPPTQKPPGARLLFPMNPTSPTSPTPLAGPGPRVGDLVGLSLGLTYWIKGLPSPTEPCPPPPSLQDLVLG